MKIFTQEGIIPSKVFDVEKVEDLRIKELNFSKPLYSIELKGGRLPYEQILGTYNNKEDAQGILNEIGLCIETKSKDEYKLPNKSSWRGIKNDLIPPAFRRGEEE